MVGQTSVVRRVDLAELAKRINAAHDAFETGMRQSLTAAAEAGELLINAKEQLRHGEWLPWLSDNFRGSHDMASRYMKLAGRLPEIEANFANVRNLSLSGALRLLDAEPSPAGGSDKPWTVQDVIDTVTLGVQKWAGRTPVECRAVLVKRLRGLADEIEKTGGVA